MPNTDGGPDTISRRSALKAGLVAAAGLTGVPALAAAAEEVDQPVARRDKRPNIVFVITDDQRYDGLSCTGHAFAKTPHVDRLAREGALFNNFFTTTPLCSPARASFLTGLYAHSNRIINNDKIGLADISHTLNTWPRLLYHSGYETAFIGKLHMGFDDRRRPGFDHWIGFISQGLYIDPVVNVDDQRQQIRGYMTDFLNDKAVAFVDRAHTKPFALFLAHKAVHFPYLPAARHDNLYADATYRVPEVPAGDVEGKPVLKLRRSPPVDMLRLEDSVPEPQESRRGRPMTADAVVRDQARCMASVDEGVGRIVAALKKRGILDDTIVVFTSDNGFLMGEHGQFDAKRLAYEESIRIPFVIRYPKLIAAGGRRDQMAACIDIMPTMLELAGVEWGESIHGKSLVPVLRDANAPLRDALLTEHFMEKVSPVPDWQSVRTARWKYIHYPDHPDMNELYDLGADPREHVNLFKRAEHADTIAQMKSELARLLAESTDRIVPYDVPEK